jgi:hypothetical protein
MRVMPFSRFPKLRCRPQSRTEIQSRQPTGNEMEARADAARESPGTIAVLDNDAMAKRAAKRATMAEIEAFALTIQDVSAGPRFASVKIDGANLEQMLANRDGTFIVNRIRAALGFGAI